jgi:hypothetical protein
MKLSVVEPAKAIKVVPKTSEYANSQNRVNAADLFRESPPPRADGEAFKHRHRHPTASVIICCADEIARRELRMLVVSGEKALALVFFRKIYARLGSRLAIGLRKLCQKSGAAFTNRRRCWRRCRSRWIQRGRQGGRSHIGLAR